MKDIEWIYIFTNNNDFFYSDRSSRRWTLVIDPQNYASNWIKNFEKENRLCVIQLNQPDYLRVLENAIQYGLPVLLENVGCELDPLMESVLMKEVFRQSGSRYIKLGENIVEYNDTFRYIISLFSKSIDKSLQPMYLF